MPITWDNVLASDQCAVGMYSSPAAGSTPPNNQQRADHFAAREQLVRPGLTALSPNRVDIAHIRFMSWSDNFNYVDQSMPQSMVTWAWDNGERIPMVTWMPGKAIGGIPGIKSGLNDKIIDAAADRIKTLPFQVIVRFAHEMNGIWYPWNPGHPASGYTYAETWKYREAWRRIVNRFRARGANNVLWFWCPGTGSVPNIASNDKWLFYPGDDYVDIVGYDGYVDPGEGFVGNFDKALTDARTPRPKLEYGALKPLAIGEVSQRDLKDIGSRARFWDDMRESLVVAHPDVKAMVFFDQDKRDSEGADADFTFDAEQGEWGRSMLSMLETYNAPGMNVRYTGPE